jgi:transaldolase
MACDILGPVHTQTSGVDGWVSFEVNPYFADDLSATVAEVRALSWLVDRSNLMVKIPATPAGITAIALATAQGFSINATLIFSAEQYSQVLDAYTRGLQSARSAGLDISKIHSVASLFVSRIDVALAGSDDTRTSAHVGHPFALPGVANARRVFDIYEYSIRSVTWRELQAAGANPQRPLWASTGVKDPDLDPTTYISSLAISGTINTMPLATMLTAAETPKRVLSAEVTDFQAAELRRALSRLDTAGDELFADLLHDGVAKFQSSWASVLKVLSTT